jgi:FkbM family methyltransferase
VWSRADTLTLWVCDAHPASNFVEGTSSFDEARMREYRRVDVKVDRLDEILRAHDLPSPDLVSVTTNGAEPDVLEGMRETMAQGLRYVALARTGAGYVERMAGLGYELLGHDDRGYTFEATRGS